MFWHKYNIFFYRMFSLTMLSWKNKGKRYTCYFKKMVMYYVSEMWSTKKSVEMKILFFERKVLKKMYGPVRNAVINNILRMSQCRNF